MKIYRRAGAVPATAMSADHLLVDCSRLEVVSFSEGRMSHIIPGGGRYPRGPGPRHEVTRPSRASGAMCVFGGPRRLPSLYLRLCTKRAASGEGYSPLVSLGAAKFTAYVVTCLP
jgi:hypothetical protein